jgi:PAS domain S-box-containing protein
MNETVCALRAEEIFKQSLNQVHQRADRLFAKLMVVQWLAGIVAALWISPRTWIGTASQTHWHVWAAIFLGGGITALPVFLAWKQPGEVLTRHVMATAQMLTSALLIHLTGGRIETHFHVFGSLAFFAFYRDWRVLLNATVIVAVDHMARGLFWPQSVFGVLTPSPWRWIEHAGWVLFEDTFLVISIQQSLSDMFHGASQRAKLETINASIEAEVADRTAELRVAHQELQASEQKFRMLSASAPIGIFQTDAAGRALYSNEYWQKITGLNLEESLGDGWRKAVHPDDAQQVFADWKTAVDHGREFDGEFRFLQAGGEVRWVHVRSTTTRGKANEVTGHVGTVEDISERKRAEAELETAHKKLLDASRRAGMAEVATGVLHNVGNVLNSVNIGISCVRDSLTKSQASRLARVAEMLRSHEDDLASYLTADAKGKQIPQYLTQLAAFLGSEQSKALQEIARLEKNVEHIKDIVSMQQSYAKVSGVTEVIPVSELVEDALRMDLSSLTRHDIQVLKEFVDEPRITIDKHKVLQILVNLVRNAKQACDDSGKSEKKLTLRVSKHENRVRIDVADNGVGIPAENLTRIFNHGFTTRTNGHGFGLHSGALAAKEIGGALRVHSDGPGTGATFTLELPLERPTAGKN